MLEKMYVILKCLLTREQAAILSLKMEYIIIKYAMQGMVEISKMQDIIDMSTACSGEVRLLVASLRSADEIAQLAAQGCNTFTIAPKIAEELVADPLTLQAAEVFEEHAREMGNIGQ